MAVHFKFRSAVDYDSILIDDQFISVANLKDRIIEQKNLGKSTDFKLVITDAQSGEEYDESFLVPRNASVIIKRVPATRAMSTLQVNENSKSSAEDETIGDKEKSLTSSMQPLALLKEEIDSMDEFGLDLYAIPEPFLTKSDVDEKSKLSAQCTKTASEWQRQTQDSTATGQGYARAGYCMGLARGRAYLRSAPPTGYVCHRCGQPGHFIQHCPTNGDTAYDMRREKLPIGIRRTRLKVDEEDPSILPEVSVGLMQPDEFVFAKEADAFCSLRSTLRDLPPELRCSLCQEIFNEAVMIPCCHYSFCDKCIRQELISKAKCPQCGSAKLKSDDLLPNIALRQAINRFLDLQDSGADEANKQHQVPGSDAAVDLEVPAAAISRLQIELRRPSASSSAPSETDAVKTETKVITTDIHHDQSATLEAKQALPTIEPLIKHGGSKVIEASTRKEEENLADAHPPVMKDVSGSVKVQNKKPVIDVLGGGTGPPSFKEAEGVALESEISKGRRKKKRTRQMPADGIAEYVGPGKSRKGDRYCYACGSPEHLARDCTEFAGPYTFHPGNFPPGGPIPVGGIPPYGAEMFWHGQYIPPPAHPFPIGYGDGMYGPPGPAMHFDVPVMPPGPFVPPYMPPFYQGPPMHSHSPYMGSGMPAMVGQAERPLTREEFLELQERERRRRLMEESQEREWVQDRSFVKEVMQNARHEPSIVEPRVHCATASAQHQSQLHRRELDRDSVRNYSDDNDFSRSKSGKNVRKLLTERLGDNEANWRPSNLSKDDFSSYDDMKSHKPHADNQSHFRRSLSFDEEGSRYHKRVSVDNEHDSDLENDVDYCYSRQETKKSRESMHGKHSKYSNSKRVDIRTEITNRGDDHSTYQKDKKNVNDSSEQFSHSECKKATGSVKHDHPKLKELRGKRNDHYDHALDEDGTWDTEVPKRKKHHSRSKSTIDMDGVDHELDARVKRKKKHSKKHHEASSETAKESKMDYTFDVLAHRYKSKYDLHLIDPPLDDSLEDSRWQLDSGLDEVELCHTHCSQHKHHHSG
ncbi:hypothetical protein O6H91_23G031200 [Diphasiastrum complanatum]|uniref:Uncharacterized protein n=4 Tax=Diphasiastrum complanatum TaxID=34168 RepID=A0ACC2A9C8_DIPCM|nr:hypothetical protein O6H91_23G031200 [Diphasiastrum complanatum]KAJ7514167.1 hypothetical protein O6H91_23G031200 [Diphasiastrum complanatum]KAJ7514169.1 hypothetical protein O6H91_23G031200 [Diphasiastrum complanatum]